MIVFVLILLVVGRRAARGFIEGETALRVHLEDIPDLFLHAFHEFLFRVSGRRRGDAAPPVVITDEIVEERPHRGADHFFVALPDGFRHGEGAGGVAGLEAFHLLPEFFGLLEQAALVASPVIAHLIVVTDEFSEFFPGFLACIGRRAGRRRGGTERGNG